MSRYIRELFRFSGHYDPTSACVHTLVNKPANDDERCVEAVESEEAGLEAGPTLL